MNNSIQSTLFNNKNKDDWKTLAHLEKELAELETLMSYDKRPVALANYDKRKKTLMALIQQKRVVETSNQGLVRKASTGDEKQKVLNDIDQEEKRTQSTIKETDSLYKHKSSLANKKLEDNGNVGRVMFTNLIDFDDICY